MMINDPLMTPADPAAKDRLRLGSVVIGPKIEQCGMPFPKAQWQHIAAQNQLLDRACTAGLLALGHFHGVNTGSRYDPNDLEIAEELMLTCYEMYRRIPTGLSPEIVFFTQHDRGDDYPKQHHMDVGGGDFMVKRQVRPAAAPP